MKVNGSISLLFQYFQYLFFEERGIVNLMKDIFCNQVIDILYVGIKVNGWILCECILIVNFVIYQYIYIIQNIVNRFLYWKKEFKIGQLNLYFVVCIVLLSLLFLVIGIICNNFILCSVVICCMDIIRFNNLFIEVFFEFYECVNYLDILIERIFIFIFLYIFDYGKKVN